MPAYDTKPGEATRTGFPGLGREEKIQVPCVAEVCLVSCFHFMPVHAPFNRVPFFSRPSVQGTGSRNRSINTMLVPSPDVATPRHHSRRSHSVPRLTTAASQFETPNSNSQNTPGYASDNHPALAGHKTALSSSHWSRFLVARRLLQPCTRGWRNWAFPLSRQPDQVSSDEANVYPFTQQLRGGVGTQTRPFPTAVRYRSRQGMILIVIF